VVLFIPIDAPYRELLLIIEAFVVVICLQIGIIYVRKYLKTRVNYTILAWGVLLFAYSGVFFLYIVADYYMEKEIMREMVLNLSYIVAIAGAAVFAYYTEREIKYNRHLISIVFLCVVGFLTLNTFIPIISGALVCIGCWLVFIILIGIYIRKFTAKMSDKWRINVYSLIIGTVLVIIGFAETADVAVEFFGGIWVRGMGDILIILGILLVSMLFIGVPSLSEFDWFLKIKYLNIVHNSGVSLAAYSFNQEGEGQRGRLEELMVAGGLSSISKIISDIIESDEHLDLVDHGDLKIMFEFGEFLINILIADEDLVVLRSKLRRFTNLIEFIYRENLANWYGDLTQFEFLDPLVKAYFKFSTESE
jgi:hypothetical protein